MPWIERQRDRLLHRVRARVGMRQHEARETIGQGRLADAGLARNQPGVRQASAFIGRKQRLLGVGMTEKQAALARQFGDALVLAHDAAPSGSSALPADSRSQTISQMRAATTSRGGRPSITTMRFGSSSESTR